MAEQIESNSMPDLGTDCAECIFFCDIEDKSNSETEFNFQATQNCKLGKISKFEKAGARFENRDGKFLVNRVCSFRRTEEWQEDNEIDWEKGVDISEGTDWEEEDSDIELVDSD